MYKGIHVATAIFINSPVSRTVSFHGVNDVPLSLGESFLAADKDGQLWAYYGRPIVRSGELERGQWGIQRGDRLPRCVGQVDLDGLRWEESLVDYGVDPKDVAS